MQITAISDLHGHYPKLEGGDLLIVAGDLTASDKPIEYHRFNLWLEKQNYNCKIVVAGNHDNLLQKYPHRIHWKSDIYRGRKTPLEWPFGGRLASCNAYLCDSGTEFEGQKIYGSPWTLRFEGMNPDCMAFTVDTEEQLAEKFAMIPDDIDILVTHSPPAGRLLDKTIDGKFVGSESLWQKTSNSPRNLKLHVFGHIHEAYGKKYWKPTKYVNASHVNENYKPVNKPIRIEL